jgi:UDP-N-acetylmuramate--alanine ligase
MIFANTQNFYLVGIKGVAMASIAQCLLDAGKNVRGADVAEDFVTAPVLTQSGIIIDDIATTPDFKKLDTQIVIYTSAHQGIDNHQVQAALALGLPVFSQAEALAEFFNQKQGIAVCGVGGKSTVSAMLSFALAKLAPHDLSFSVGVGEIIGMQRTGQWQPDGKYFVAEADEYVIEPHAWQKGLEIVPRFSFLKPFVTICTNLRFDHPDVYHSFEETKAYFGRFFRQIKADGYLIINADNPDLVELAKVNAPESVQILTFSAKGETDVSLEKLPFKLQVLGQFNQMNALAAYSCLKALGFAHQEILDALADFRSTKRRFELVKTDDKHRHFDDYAHHPSELKAVIETLNENFPEARKLIAFQSHTFSRTRELFEQFVDVLGSVSAPDEVLLIEIFPSAREAFDMEMNSDLLVGAVSAKYPDCKIRNLSTIDSLATYIKNSDYDIFITIGAGDIYKVHDLL